MDQTRLLRPIIACLIAALAGCQLIAPAPAPRPIPVAQLPGWSDDDLAGIEAAIEQQCTVAPKRLPAGWAPLCAEFAQLPAQSGDATPPLRDWIERRFDAWPLLDDSGGSQGLITGYYEPLLTGSRVRESERQVALHRRPDDLLTIELDAVEPRLKGLRLRGRLEGTKVVPYWSRSEIQDKAPLPGAELIWVDDAVDAFFLQIQGSGRVRLRDGTELRVGYADQNGHPYRAIGRELIEAGALRREEVTAPAIKAWLRANPQRAADVMNSNRSYVFFRELPAPAARARELGPPGSLGVPLAPMRAIAVDRRVVPLGSLVWLDTFDPIDSQPLRRLVAAQDTGGAITGPIRADLFWGFGERAERGAGLMKSPGRMWMLWPRGQTPPAREAPKN